MGGFIILFLFCVQSSVLKVTHARFQATKCGDAGPDIHYPYHIKGQYQHHESLPAFELLCKDNLTTIHFPSYGDLEVKSIAYDTKNMHLLDPKKCVHHVFLNLNLSLTPFHYFYVLKNYTYLNCSTTLPPPLVEVPCLSAASYHVYTVDSALPVPGSCETVKTVAIPFAYSPYLSDSTLGLRLTWDMSEPEDTRTIKGSHTSRNIGKLNCFFFLLSPCWKFGLNSFDITVSLVYNFLNDVIVVPCSYWVHHRCFCDGNVIAYKHKDSCGHEE